MIGPPEIALRRVCVAYLAWGPLGVGHVRRFVDSYIANPAGVDHALVIILNHVGREDRDEIAGMLRDIPHSTFAPERPVLDLEAYRLLTETIAADAYCFFNTYSRVLAPGWLFRYVAALRERSIGVAAAGGSYRSLRDFNPWRSGPTMLPLPKKALLQLATTRRALRIRRQFPPNPCASVRSNAFALRASTLALIDWPKCESKMDTWLWESGRQNLTVRTREAGLRAVVVDRYGAIFDVPDWPQSATFWSRDQDGLLVADNRSDEYACATAHDRRRLMRENWSGDELGHAFRRRR